VRFWDTSAVVPLLVEQDASQVIDELSGEDPAMAVWWGTTVECASAIARLERAGGLFAGGADAGRARLAAFSESWHEVQPSEAVRRTAQRVLRLHPLRAADALQAAAALVLAEHDPSSVDVVCLDGRLTEALHREGFTVLGRG
jgi:hypothetical protein